MIDTRQIKKVLAAHYGRDKVRVTMSRGHWARVHIDLTPLDYDQANMMRDEARNLLVAAGCDLGRAFTDDDCRYMMDRVHIGFNNARFWRTFVGQIDGKVYGQVDQFTPEWIAA